METRRAGMETRRADMKTRRAGMETRPYGMWLASFTAEVWQYIDANPRRWREDPYYSEP